VADAVTGMIMASMERKKSRAGSGPRDSN